MKKILILFFFCQIILGCKVSQPVKIIHDTVYMPMPIVKQKIDTGKSIAYIPAVELIKYSRPNISYHGISIATGHEYVRDTYNVGLSTAFRYYRFTLDFSGQYLYYQKVSHAPFYRFGTSISYELYRP